MCKRSCTSSAPSPMLNGLMPKSVCWMSNSPVAVSVRPSAIAIASTGTSMSRLASLIVMRAMICGACSVPAIATDRSCDRADSARRPALRRAACSCACLRLIRLRESRQEIRCRPRAGLRGSSTISSCDRKRQLEARARELRCIHTRPVSVLRCHHVVVAEPRQRAAAIDQMCTPTRCGSIVVQRRAAQIGARARGQARPWRGRRRPHRRSMDRPPATQAAGRSSRHRVPFVA